VDNNTLGSYRSSIKAIASRDWGTGLLMVLLAVAIPAEFSIYTVKKVCGSSEPKPAYTVQ
jgi:hypothetical protein